MTATSDPFVGESFTLSSTEGTIGHVTIEAIYPDGTVRSQLRVSEPEGPASRTLSSLRGVADAADDLAFAVMDVHERALQQVGLALVDEAARRTLSLGRDFKGLFVDPTLSILSFRLVPDRG